MNISKQHLPAIFVSSLLSLGLQVASLAESSKDAVPAVAQTSFDTPELAVKSLIEAVSSFEIPALKKILGPDSDDLISTGDPVMAKKQALEFAAKAKEKQQIEIDAENPNQAILLVGQAAFPLPIPIVKENGKWSFDTKAGLEEMLCRRIGANELDAIEICRGYVEVQYEYAQSKHEGAKINQYAQRIVSTPGKKDGLAWKNEDGSWGGPIGEDIVKALEQGYTEKGKPQPYHGYYFKILKGQGPAAPMGELDFVINGSMIGGFALAVAPANYGVSGVKTFIVSHNGIVYEKDLGEGTLEILKKMDRYNPDESWQVTEDKW